MNKIIIKLEDIINSRSGIEKIVAQTFLDNIANLKQLTLAQLARRSFVSTATIIRFCKSLDFSGFSEFKYSLSNEYYEKMIKKQI